MNEIKFCMATHPKMPNHSGHSRGRVVHIIKEGNTTHCNMMVDKYWKGKKIPGIEYNRKCKVCLMKSGYGNLQPH